MRADGLKMPYSMDLTYLTLMQSASSRLISIFNLLLKFLFCIQSIAIEPNYACMFVCISRNCWIILAFHCECNARLNLVCFVGLEQNEHSSWLDEVAAFFDSDSEYQTSFCWFFFVIAWLLLFVRRRRRK